MSIKRIESEIISNDALDLISQMIHVKIKFHENKKYKSEIEEDINARETKVKKAMKNQKSFKLIDGNFSTNESREILQNVFTSKIQFHQRKEFSSQERFGKEDVIASKRIPQLKKSLEEILKMIKAAEKEGQQLEIKSEIVVNFIQSVKIV